MGFPPTVCFVGDAFVALQQDRHEADYDPAHRVLKTDAVAAIALAEKAIADLDAAPRKDRVAFAIQLLLKKRP